MSELCSQEGPLHALSLTALTMANAVTLYTIHVF
jgi:hypothetical protein